MVEEIREGKQELFGATQEIQLGTTNDSSSEQPPKEGSQPAPARSSANQTASYKLDFAIENVEGGKSTTTTIEEEIIFMRASSTTT